VSWRDFDHRCGYRSTSTPTLARCRQRRTAASPWAADTLIRNAPDNAESVRVFADYCAESAYCWDPYRGDRRRRIAVVVTTVSERVGVSPTRATRDGERSRASPVREKLRRCASPLPMG